MQSFWTIATVIALTLAAGAPTSQQQTPPSPGIREAMARMQAQDPAGAAKILEGVTAREPQNGRAWRLLGVALQQIKQLDRALEAYRKALAIGPDAVALYNTGVIYALKQNKEQAFEWLTRAKASGIVDMTAIQTDASLAALKSDPRFKALLPTPAHFERPFVEDTKIIHEWKGEAIQDQFGWIARDIGDVDKDGIHDFVTSAPGHGASGSAGRVYVYSTKSGRLLWKADGDAGDRLGTGLEAAGDTNRDGTPDVIAGAPGSNRVIVYSGKDGATLLTVRAPDGGGNAGGAVAGTGDVNGDGHADVIVGAPPPRSGGTGPGFAYVFSGKDGALLQALKGEREGDLFGSAVAGHVQDKRILLVVGAAKAGPARTGRTYVYDGLTDQPQFLIEADDTGAALGAMFVSVPGDVNGDGVADVYAADFANWSKGLSTGRTYIHSGKDGRRLLTLTGETAGEGFGTSPATAGDLDGDGHADLAVGAWQYAGATTSGGRVYLHSGRDGRLLRTYTCRIPGDTLGFDAVGIGDVDGDGTIDLLLTSAYSGVNGYRSGRVFVVSSGIQRKS